MGRFPKPGWTEIQRELFGNLLDGTIDTFTFLPNMKQVEMAVAGLRTLVRISELNDREILADS